MNNWAERAATNMLRLSRNQTLKEAMREWVTTGGYEDTHNIQEVCELCEHEGLRYQYEIENKITGRSLWVGSTCITKFVPLYDNGIEIIDEDAKASLLRRRQAEYEANSRERRALQLLEQLARVNPEVFAQSSWRVNWKRGYSVKQLIMISITCKKNSLPFNSADFRINTRREAVVAQLWNIEPWQYRRIRAALPNSRRKQFDQVFLSP